MPTWRADQGVVVRTPLLPFQILAEWAQAPDPRRYLASLLELPEVQEAVFLASPTLSAAIPTWLANPTSAAGQRLEIALVKYIARMAGRATPFGLCSGVSSGALGRETKIELAPRATYRRRTRLDNDYLFALAEALARIPQTRDHLVYRPNTSLYRVGDRLRYAAAVLRDKDRSYELHSAELTPYLEATLERASRGARLIDLATPLVDAEITLDEARGYIGELIDVQILAPELGVHVTGPEPIDGMIAQLRAAAIAETVPALESVRAALQALDAGGVGNPSERYREVASQLEPLPTSVDLARLFQVDMVKPASITIGHRVVADLARVVEQLARISGRPSSSLDDFRRAFAARWEEREVPLAEVLDEESGIGFETIRGPGAEGSPLLVGLPFPGSPGDETFTWRASHAHLQRRLAIALAAGDAEIVLEDADFDAMQAREPAELPDAFATMVRLSADDSILFEGTSGPSGARLLGRFCHGCPEIEAIVRAHHAAEEALAPDVTFAEIVHLNEGRMGNILCRPVLRGSEIVFLGISGAPREQQLLLDDLLVSVSGDRVVLRSRRLGREVIPRLTTAHNYRRRSLGVYRFLCVLSEQGRYPVGFSWGVLGGAPRLPRVRYGRVVLSRATWNLDQKELAKLDLARLRDTLRLPRWVVLVDGDHELPIDLDNPLLAAALARELAGRRSAMLMELFPAPDQQIVRGPEGTFANEIVLTFTRAKPVERRPEPTRPAIVARRQFAPGSEWLFAKIYAGESSGDRVLREAIAPVLRDPAVQGAFDRWFFIRYADPDTHIRVRFHGEPHRLSRDVLPALEQTLAPLFEGGVARKLMLDTYDRELERYAAIDLIEEIFWRDSEAVLGIVERLEGDAGADARWRLAVRGIDSLLDVLGLDVRAREDLVTQAREMLGREIAADRGLWSRIGDRFTKQRASLEMLCQRDAARDAAHDLAPGFALLAARDSALAAPVAELRRRDAAGQLSPSVREMAWSICHMHANRMLHASQRAQELVLYDFLRRIYSSRRARQR